MSSIKTFEEIIAWQKAREANKLVYKMISGSNNFSKDFSLMDQIKRASGSVMDNIAEGFERGGNKEFIQFLYIAKGSASEVKSQLYRALDYNYIDKETFNNAFALFAEIGKLISGLINYLKESDMKGDKYKTTKQKL